MNNNTSTAAYNEVMKDKEYKARNAELQAYNAYLFRQLQEGYEKSRQLEYEAEHRLKDLPTTQMSKEESTVWATTEVVLGGILNGFGLF